MTNEVENMFDKFINDNLEKTPLMDHVRNGVLAFTNLFGPVGVGISFFGNIIIPEQRKKRVINFINSISLEIENIKNKIDKEYIKTNEFAFIFEQTFKGIIENYKDEKTECFRAIFLNTLTNPKSVSEEEKELFIRLVNDLTVRHIKILNILRDPVAYKRGQGNNIVKLGNEISTLFILRQLFTDYTEDDIVYITKNLDNMNLTNLGNMQATSKYKGILLLENKLTNFGRKFVDYIKYIPGR